jgi:hypothetical protein
MPPFFNIWYGGLITSGVRAKMFEAAFPYKEHIISFATDGIYATVPIPVPESSRLGDWEYKTFDAFTLVQSGVYWTHTTTREYQEEMCSLHGHYCKRGHFYRGFDKEFLTEEKVLQAWRDGLKELPVPTTRFITLGTALQSWETDNRNWRTWETTDRILKLTAMGKREDMYTLVYPYTELVQTRAAPGRNGGVFSTPLSFPWDVEFEVNYSQLLEHAEYWEIEENAFE